MNVRTVQVIPLSISDEAGSITYAVTAEVARIDADFSDNADAGTVLTVTLDGVTIVTNTGKTDFTRWPAVALQQADGTAVGAHSSPVGHTLKMTVASGAAGQEVKLRVYVR